MLRGAAARMTTWTYTTARRRVDELGIGVENESAAKKWRVLGPDVIIDDVRLRDDS